MQHHNRRKEFESLLNKQDFLLVGTSAPTNQAVVSSMNRTQPRMQAQLENCYECPRTGSLNIKGYKPQTPVSVHLIGVSSREIWTTSVARSGEQTELGHSNYGC